MKLINVHAAKTNLSRILDQVSAGEEVVLARAGKPVAKLAPIEAKPAKRRLGMLAGKLTVPDDFDAPLPADLAEAFEQRG